MGAVEIEHVLLEVNMLRNSIVYMLSDRRPLFTLRIKETIKKTGVGEREREKWERTRERRKKNRPIPNYYDFIKPKSIYTNKISE